MRSVWLKGLLQIWLEAKFSHSRVDCAYSEPVANSKAFGKLNLQYQNYKEIFRAFCTSLVNSDSAPTAAPRLVALPTSSDIMQS